MNNKVWCFFGVHSYQVKQKGGVTNDYGAQVGFWTFSECSVCHKCKYKQHC